MTALRKEEETGEGPFFALVPPRQEDLQALGFASFAEYRLWCLREGYEDGLGRSKAERQPVLPLPTGQTAPHDTQERQEKIRRMVAGRTDAYGWLEGNDGARQALLRLMLHANGYVDVLKRKLLPKEIGRYPRLIAGLVALAYHHQHWIRPVEEWRSPLPQNGHPTRQAQFSSLVRHLLARYEVPVFMDSVWFEGLDEEGQQQQAWFMQVAGGGNIRAMDTPIRLTRRMAHLFMGGAYSSGGVKKNMRWAQAIAMGGSLALARALIRTRLGRRFEDDDFWSQVVFFLAQNAMMDPALAGPVIDYVYSRKFAPTRIVQEDGGVAEGPPPQPDFTMKGRSAHKLLRQVETWHEQLGREGYVAFQTWGPCGVDGWTLEEEIPELGPVRWTVQELLSSEELRAEGRAMHHCIVSYWDQCVEGNTAVWSICVQGQEAAERENVLTAALDIQSRTITQARGRYNAMPNQRPHSAQTKQEAPSGYFLLLSRANIVLNRWVKRAGLRRDG
ncbi:MAG: hypothetical protein GKR89_30510 [Candidatus Latescibacteria bacterium]|nr:hypothetical protein [Candidatus Latescibacterota bacterium]